jgi:hypothetical protein
MDYKNGKIYTIRSHQTGDIYIGSTTQTLTKRLSKHKNGFKRWKNGKGHYTSSFEIIKYDDAYIELLELCPCDSKMELHKREGQLIREMNCVNRCVAGRTDKEWRDDNKEKRKEYIEANKDKIKEKTKEWRETNKEKIKEWREENKEKLKEYYEEYREANKDKIKEYRENNKDKIKIRDKEYYETNKDKIKIQTKEYREKNRDKMKEYHKEWYEENKDKYNNKYDCECGGKYTHIHKSRHLKSQKHTNYIISKNNTE